MTDFTKEFIAEARESITEPGVERYICIPVQLEMLDEIERLQSRIAELEANNAEFRQLIRDWSIVLDQNNGFQLWYVESVRQAMLEINKEREE